MPLPAVLIANVFLYDNNASDCDKKFAMNALEVIEIFAGYRPDGQTVVERLPVKVLEDDSCQLVKSPAFVQGLASGDVIKLQEDRQQFELVRHSGNLAIRVLAMEGLEDIAEALIAELEKLGGALDSETERLLVFSIHVSCGFGQIEDILNRYCNELEECSWTYGNVYDPKDGTTPLNWWQEILKPQ